MDTVFIFDIDTTIANTDERAKQLIRNCIRCGSSMVGLSYSRHKESFECPCCGSTEGKIPQQAWDNFMSEDLISQDKPESDAQRLVRSLRNFGASIHFLTGRQERLRAVTEKWLEDHMDRDASKEKLIMRQEEHDGLAASVYKEYEFLRLREELETELGKSLLYVFFEDDPFVFNVYSKYGIVVESPEALRFFCPTGAPRGLEKAYNR